VKPSCALPPRPVALAFQAPGEDRPQEEEEGGEAEGQAGRRAEARGRGAQARPREFPCRARRRQGDRSTGCCVLRGTVFATPPGGGFAVVLVMGSARIPRVREGCVHGAEQLV